jgi:hypothetical protein
MNDDEENNSTHTYVFIDENPAVVLENMKTLEDRLNRVLASSWWQKYIAAAFWSNMSTPVNLTIMLLTTLTTGQATTSNLLSSESFVSISITSLILSVINTFFRPHAQMNDNLEVMRKWQSLGTKFERIYYSKNNEKDDYERRLKDYAKLQKEIHALQNAPTPTSQNFFTDLIYYAISFVLIKKQRDVWISDEGLPKNHTVGVQTTPKIERKAVEIQTATTDSNTIMESSIV